MPRLRNEGQITSVITWQKLKDVKRLEDKLSSIRTVSELSNKVFWTVSTHCEVIINEILSLFEKRSPCIPLKNSDCNVTRDQYYASIKFAVENNAEFWPTTVTQCKYWFDSNTLCRIILVWNPTFFFHYIIMKTK